MDVDVLLCDHAQVAGKLFISGANIDRFVFAAETPAPYLLTFALAGVVHVPFTATNTPHELAFTIVTEDGHPPLLGSAAPGEQPSASPIAGAMQFNVGRPPTLGSGQEQLVPFAFSFQGLPFALPGRYLVQLTLDDDPVRGVPFTVHVEQAAGFRGPDR